MIRIELSGMNQAAACGHVIKGKGYQSPLGKLARQLVDDGYASHDIAMIYRGDTLCFNPCRLSYWAEHDATEGDNYSARITKHKPFSADVWG